MIPLYAVREGRRVKYGSNNRRGTIIACKVLPRDYSLAKIVRNMDSPHLVGFPSTRHRKRKFMVHMLVQLDKPNCLVAGSQFTFSLAYRR